MAGERGRLLITKYRVGILYLLFWGDWKSHYVFLGQSMFWGNDGGIICRVNYRKERLKSGRPTWWQVDNQYIR